MSIITKGLGSQGLITQGYGWLQRIIKVIKKVISRVIPWKRKRFKFKIKVCGDLVVPFKQEFKIQGIKDFSPVLFILLDDEDIDSMDKKQLKKEKELLDKLLEMNDNE